MNPSRFATPSDEIEIHLPDGRTLRGPRGATAESLLQPIVAGLPAPLVGAVVNGDLRELTHPVDIEARISPLTMADADGARIYRRSLTFLLEAAFAGLFPEAFLYIDHSLSSGGYLCHVRGRDLLTACELEDLTAGMRRLVEQNLPISGREATVQEAIVFFEANNDIEKVRLMRHRSKPTVTLYRLGDRVDYHHGFMVPSTGYLQWFELAETDGGFALRYPRQHTPTQLEPMFDSPKLLAAFRQHGAWLERLGISSVGALDDAIKGGRSRQPSPPHVRLPAASTDPIVLGKPVAEPSTVATRHPHWQSHDLAGCGAGSERFQRLHRQSDRRRNPGSLQIDRANRRHLCRTRLAACLAGLIQRVKAGAIPAGSVIAATMTGHGLKDPDNAIKTAGFEPTVVPPTMEAVMKVIGL